MYMENNEMKHGKYLTGLICLTLIAVCLSACMKHDDYAMGEATESSQIQTTETGDMDNPEVDHSTASENDDRDRISVKENDTGNITSDKISETEKQINELPEVGISNNPAAVKVHNTSEKEQESPAGKAEMSTQNTDENIDKKENDETKKQKVSTPAENFLGGCEFSWLDRSILL